MRAIGSDARGLAPRSKDPHGRPCGHTRHGHQSGPRDTARGSVGRGRVLRARQAASADSGGVQRGQPLTYDFSVITEKGVTTSSD
jgi:hypothetical protein